MELDDLFSVIEDLRKTIESVGGLADISYTSEQWDGRTSTIVITDECNLRCTYCYCTKTPQAMTWETAKEYIDLLFENNLSLASIAKEDQKEIHHRKIFEFIGGEPLLQADLMFTCMNYIYDKVNMLPDNHPWKRCDWPCLCGQPHAQGIRFMISTNGILLNDESIRQRFEDFPDGLVNIGVTLDGTKTMHDLCRVTTSGEGSYDDVMTAWKWLAGSKFHGSTTSTKSTIAHENLDYIYDITLFFYDLGLTSLAQNCVFENVWHRGDQHRLLNQLVKVADWLIETNRWEKFKIRWFSPTYFSQSQSESKWCGAGTYMDCCDYLGKIYPCLRFKQLKQQAPYEIGDTKTGINQEIVEQFTQCATNAIYNEKQKDLSGLSKCATCPTSALCSDCQAFAYDCFANVEAKTPFICPMHKAACVANIYFFGKLLGVTPDLDDLREGLEAWTKDDYFSTDGDYTKWLSHQTSPK
jgi:radical SAM peptide maturase (CXXX-repeat target family)